jgi:Uma2 family endonuclease
VAGHTLRISPAKGRERTVERRGEVEAQAMVMSSADLAAAAESELADLEELWQRLDLPGHRVELIDGQIVVSPSGSVWHASAIEELMDQLIRVKWQHGWRFHPTVTIHIPATRERLIPDLMVAPAAAPRYDENELLAAGVLLVAEVVSPSSRRQDRETKNRVYAQGGVPLYLLIDKLAAPPSVTLFTEPGEDGYRGRETAAAGQPLRLPDPFSLSLDTARLLA